MNKPAKPHGWSQRLAQEQARRHRRKVWLITLAAVVVAAAGVLVAVSLGGGGKSDTPAAVPAAVSDDGVGLVVGSGPVTVEVYSDFLCPACRNFETDARNELDTMLEKNQIRLIYRPVAILDRLSTNEYSTRSASGAGCASDAGKLMDYVAVLFDNQPAEGGAGFENDELIRLAGQAGITGPTFQQCLRDEKYRDWVGDVTDSMSPNDVRGTPTVFVDGEQLQENTGPALVAAVANGSE